VGIYATVAGAGKITSFRFTAPAALTSATAVYETETRATLSAELDLSSVADGALAISAEATDEYGRSSTRTLTVYVAQNVPTINVTVPADNATVSGTLNISASASAQDGATITSLVLVDPPLGVGVDVLPATNALLAEWNTTLAAEGVTPLHFRAVDSSGLAGDLTILVTVDNVAMGTVDAYVNAGAPVQGATVEVYAINNATGAVNTAFGTNGLIGTASPTDNSGHITVPITAENYTGPIRIIAKPTTGANLTYLDPSYPANTVMIPSSLRLSSILPSYVAGTSISAPVTLWTTLADAEVLTYAAGRHRAYGSTSTITEACYFADPLFAAHLQPTAPRWDLRTTIPISLTDGNPHTISDRDYASFAEVALNRLARDLGEAAQIGNVITAPYLLDQILLPDLQADGQFDGLASGGAQLYTIGSPGQTIDANTLRVKLASALDEFIMSTRNLSGITRADLDGAGVYTAISNDTSDLFGSQEPLPFDNTAPSVSWQVTYGTSQTAPYGSSRYVSKSLNIRVTATDSSGVSALTLKAGSQILTPTLTTNGDGSWTATTTVDTTTVANGALVLSATATDTRSNSGTPSYSVTVDNQAPLLIFTTPSASSFYSASVPFDVTATDSGSDIQSLNASGFSGLVDNDSAITHFTGTWTVPVGVADGLFGGGSFTACDRVGNCATPSAPVTIDRTPPVLAWVTAPPTSTSSSTVTLTVEGADAGSGIASVWARVAGSSPLQATPVSGSVNQWQVTLPLQQGNNTVQVWGRDNAITAVDDTPNVGDGRAAPYMLSAAVLIDSVAPTAAIDSTFQSYRSESGMMVLADDTGRALMPPAYVYAGSKTAIIDSTTIYKSATRLGWTIAPTSAELEEANSGNYPVLRFSVPYNPITDSSIASATYSVTASCNGCSGATMTGNLWASSVTSPTAVMYLLPLSSNLVPDLALAQGAVTLNVSLALADAGGNTNSVEFTFNFRVIGPPLAVTEDTTYAELLDPRSTHYYRLANSTYTGLFDPLNTTLASEGVRLVRYIVTNPAPTPVAVSLPVVGSTWAISEAWTAKSDPYPTGATYNWVDHPDWVNEDLCGQVRHPCGATRTDTGSYATSTWTGKVAWKPIGGSSTYSCAPAGDSHTLTPTNISPTIQSAPLEVRAYYPQGGVFDTTPAATTNTGEFIVPAAAGVSPGTLALYIVRPSPDARSGSSPTLTWGDLWAVGTSRYESFLHDGWKPDVITGVGTNIRVMNGEVRCAVFGTYVVPYRAYRFGHFLAGATDNLNGSPAPITRGINGTSEVFGEHSTLPALAVTRTIGH
jgi:hypothetical protein